MVIVFNNNKRNNVINLEYELETLYDYKMLINQYKLNETFLYSLPFITMDNKNFHPIMSFADHIYFRKNDWEITTSKYQYPREYNFKPETVRCGDVVFVRGDWINSVKKIIKVRSSVKQTSITSIQSNVWKLLLSLLLRGNNWTIKSFYVCVCGF